MNKSRGQPATVPNHPKYRTHLSNVLATPARVHVGEHLLHHVVVHVRDVHHARLKMREIVVNGLSLSFRDAHVSL